MRCLWGPLLPLFSLLFAASQLLNCRSVSPPDPRLWCHLATPNYPTFLPSGLWVISLPRSGHTEYPELEGAHKNNRPAANRPQRAQSGLRQRCYSPGYLGGRTKELSALSQCGRSRFLLRKQQNETLSFVFRADFETFPGPAGCLAPAAQLSEGEAGEEGQSSFLFWLSFDGLESVSLNPRPGRRAQGSLPLKAAADLWVR